MVDGNRIDGEFREFIIVVVLFISAVFAILAMVNHYVMLEETVIGEVVNVRHFSGLWKHTDVTFASYGGSEIKYVYEGWLELDIGCVYRITGRGEWLTQFYPEAVSIIKMLE